MNQQWLTTLMSNVKSQLENHGIRLSPADLAALLEEISPKTSNAALSYAMDLLRPFSAGMGFRVSRLADLQVELIIPARTRNLNENKEIHEGALLAGALEGARLLWERHAPIGDFRLRMHKNQMQIFKPAAEEVRVRLELPEALRESVLASIRKNRQAQVEMQAQIYDEKDQAVAEIHFSLELTHTPTLGTK
jgi:hypothetical protein